MSARSNTRRAISPIIGADRGHILLVLEGELESELRDGRKFTLSAGMSYQVSDFGDAAHRSYTPKGAKLFIVD